MHTTPRATIALVGAGPRGASLLERIGAHLGTLTHTPPLDIHVIDDAPRGAGRIWRTDQPRDLCMNTLAHAVTLFTEPGSTVSGPVVEGPTLYEWCALLRDEETPGIAAAHVETFRRFRPPATLAEAYREELAALKPESHPSRALYGEYLGWAFSRAESLVRPYATVHHHPARAISATHLEAQLPSNRTLITLSDGTSVAADAVILATGWLPVADSPEEQAFERRVQSRPGLTWVKPGSPIEQDLSQIEPGSASIIRGLGMSFFDTVSLLTIGRGGHFTPSADSVSGLRYHASGAEPVMHATSRRGAPFRAKSLYHALPPSPSQRFARSVDWSRAPRPINFNATFWPRVVADAFLDHALTLSQASRGAVLASEEQLTSTVEQALDEALARESDDLEAPVALIGEAVAPLIAHPGDRFDLMTEMRLGDLTFGSPEAYQRHTLERTAQDLRDAVLGAASPTKAGLWSISGARGVANQVGTLGGFDAESRATGFRLLSSLGGMVGSGPPAFRVQQLLALAEAGLVSFIGPNASVHVTDDSFVAESPNVAGSRVTATSLVEAWMKSHDLAQSADDLTRDLVAGGNARGFTVRSRGGARRPTRSFEINPGNGKLIGADGTEDPSIHVAGIPVDDQLHGTVISPMPGTNPPMLRETDRVAASALRTALAALEERQEGGLRVSTPVTP